MQSRYESRVPVEYIGFSHAGVRAELYFELFVRVMAGRQYPPLK